MNSMVDSLFDQYDRGRMTRRHLVQALAALVLPTPTLAQDGARASGPIVRGLSVNHVALTVSDVPRSFAFYERLFGVTKGWLATDAVRVSIWTCLTGTSASIQWPHRRA